MAAAIMYMMLFMILLFPDKYVTVRNYVFSKIASGFNYVRNLFKGD